MKSHLSGFAALLLVSSSLSAASYTINDITGSQYGYSYAYDINDAGQVVGVVQNSALFYDPAAGVRWVGFSSGDSRLTGINNLGVAVGFAVDEDPYKNFTVEYGSTPEQVLSNFSFPDITDSGMVFSSSPGAGYAGPTDLLSLLPSTPGWISLTPYAMNSSGQIVGVGVTAADTSNNVQAFLMTPVPLPASSWLLGSGLIGLVGMARRKQA